MSVAVARSESVCALAGRVGVDPGALLTANGLDQRPEQALRPEQLEIPPNAGLRHRIQPGQTLFSLARWYGHPIATLASLNDIADPDVLFAGTWLEIPAGAKTGCPPTAPTVVARASAAHVAPPAAKAPPAPVAPPAPKTSPALLPADELLSEAHDRYDAADFEAVLELTQAARRALPPEADDPAGAERRARAIWLAGLAQAGLDRRDEAVASLREALVLRPSLRDDPNLSPRILGLLDAEAAPPRQP
jgi:LysM repeat protein